MMKLQRILFSSAIIAVLCIPRSSSASLLEWIFGEGTSRSYTYEMTPVSISLGSVELKVPKAYLPERKYWEGGQFDRVDINAVLPDMLPFSHLKDTDDASTAESRNAARKKNFEEAEKGPDHIYIYLRRSSKPIMSDYYGRMFKYYQSYLEPSDIGALLISDRALFDSRRGIIFAMGLSPHERHYLEEIPGKRLLTMRCEKQRNISCPVNTNMGDYLYVEYTAFSKYMPQRWKEVDAKVVAFIKSLYAAPPEIPTFAENTNKTPPPPCPKGQRWRKGDKPTSEYYIGVCSKNIFFDEQGMLASAQEGVANAQAMLGVMYLTGDEVERNYEVAYFWLSLAYSNRNPPDNPQYPDHCRYPKCEQNEWLKQFKPADAAKQLSKAQRQKLDRQIKEWVPAPKKPMFR